MNKDNQNNKETHRKQLKPYHDLVRAEAVRRTASEFNRSIDWVYKLLRGAWTSKNTGAALEYFKKEYASISEKLNS